jgi:acyl-CoA reductase-like NAD-dependent aldehyde dehydrogenase
MEIRGEQYVGGRWMSSNGTDRISVTDPSTEEVLGTVASGAPDDVDLAVRAAKDAFETWSVAPLSDRLDRLARAAALLAERKEEVARAITREVGTPISFARSTQLGLSLMDFAAVREVATSFPFEERLDGSLVVREPIGVVACITPWNYPLHQITAKIVPALAVGCTVVVKPSDLAPFNAFALAAIFEDAGLPPGVFNLITGYGTPVGEALAGHPGVDMVSFTGSTKAGRLVSQIAAQTVKRVSLELGGKSASLVFDDADPDRAVSHAFTRCFANSGQTCSALTRMFVPSRQLREYEERAVAVAEGYLVGPPMAEDTMIGPMVSAAQRERVRGYIERGLVEGARLLTGGAQPPDSLPRGYYVRPTVFSNVVSAMTLAQEEIFGPVLSLLAYDAEDEAVAMANDTIYGLSAAVWSADLERAGRVARRLRSGQVAANGAAHGHLVPFGGYKQSGNGRELGRYGLEGFLETKAITW